MTAGIICMRTMLRRVLPSDEGQLLTEAWILSQVPDEQLGRLSRQHSGELASRTNSGRLTQGLYKTASGGFSVCSHAPLFSSSTSTVACVFGMLSVHVPVGRLRILCDCHRRSTFETKTTGAAQPRSLSSRSEATNSCTSGQRVGSRPVEIECRGWRAPANLVVSFVKHLIQLVLQQCRMAGEQ